MIEDLLIHDVVVVRHEPSTAKARYGSDVPGAEIRVAEKWNVQQQDAREILVDRDTRISTWLGFAPASSVVTSVATLEWGGRKFNVVGEPDPVYDFEQLHHYEVNLELIRG